MRERKRNGKRSERERGTGKEVREREEREKK